MGGEIEHDGRVRAFAGPADGDGVPQELDLDNWTTLLDALNEQLQLTGPRRAVTTASADDAGKVVRGLRACTCAETWAGLPGLGWSNSPSRPARGIATHPPGYRRPAHPDQHRNLVRSASLVTPQHHPCPVVHHGVGRPGTHHSGQSIALSRRQSHGPYSTTSRRGRAATRTARTSPYGNSQTAFRSYNAERLGAL
jgi:hypothetical protein